VWQVVLEILDSRLVVVGFGVRTFVLGKRRAARGGEERGHVRFLTCEVCNSSKQGAGRSNFARLPRPLPAPPRARDRRRFRKPADAAASWGPAPQRSCLAALVPLPRGGRKIHHPGSRP